MGVRCYGEKQESEEDGEGQQSGQCCSFTTEVTFEQRLAEYEGRCAVTGRGFWAEEVPGQRSLGRS